MKRRTLKNLEARRVNMNHPAVWEAEYLGYRYRIIRTRRRPNRYRTLVYSPRKDGWRSIRHIHHDYIARFKSMTIAKVVAERHAESMLETATPIDTMRRLVQKKRPHWRKIA